MHLNTHKILTDLNRLAHLERQRDELQHQCNVELERYRKTRAELAEQVKLLNSRIITETC